MPKPIAVIAADTHLAPRAWASHPGISGDAYYSFKQIIDFCWESELPLILAGDVFDKTRIDPATISSTRILIERMRKMDRRIHYIQGQHELDRIDPWLNAISDWPRHIHAQTAHISGINLYGLDWTPADQVKEEFDKLPPTTDLLVAHQVWKDLMGRNIGDAECSFSDVPFVHMIATGDYHRHLNFIATNQQCKPVKILSPGSICMQSIDENPAKFIFILNDSLVATSHQLKTRQCFRFTINTQEELEIFLENNIAQIIVPQENVAPEIARNIVHVLYLSSIPEAYTRISNALSKKVHLFAVPMHNKKEEITTEKEKRRLFADGGLESCLELISDKDSFAYKDILALLKSNNPQEQLNNLRINFAKRSLT